MRLFHVGSLALALLLSGGGIAFGQSPYGNPYETRDDSPYGKSYTQTEAAPVVGDINVFWGDKTLDSNWIAEVQDQSERALLFDIKSAYWPVALAVDLRISEGKTFYSSTYGLYLHAETFEFNLGGKHIMRAGGILRPYVGLGLSFAAMALMDNTTNSSVDTISGKGFWAGFGTYIDLFPHAHLAVDYTLTDVDAEGFPIGGRHLGLMLGYHWR